LASPRVRCHEWREKFSDSAGREGRADWRNAERTRILLADTGGPSVWPARGKQTVRKTAKRKTMTASVPAEKPKRNPRSGPVADSAKRPKPAAISPPENVRRWTFLTNHAHVLVLLHLQPGLVLRAVAVQVGITERAVQRIIQELEEGGFIRREKVGRQNHYEVLVDRPLRHPIEAHRRIGDLLSLISG